MKRILYSLVIFNVSGLKINYEEHLDILDYGINWQSKGISEKPDIRTKFLEEKDKKKKSKKRITALENAASNDIEYADGTPHHKFNIHMNKIQGIETIENTFKSMVNMEGVQYEYKRDMHWRTWREVTYPNNSKIIVSYKCDNIVNTTCEKCLGSGTWTIEENLLCPYEIFSINNKNEICAVNYKQIKKINEKCPITIKLSDLRDCNNPMETKYLVKRDFKTAPERNRTNLCKEREYCEITTLYQISPKKSIFKIINSTNHVIYSRIMKFGGNNYICIEDCGSYDPVTKKISSNEKPLIVDLLDKSHKNKREFMLLKKIVPKSEIINVSSTTTEPFEVGMKIFKNPYYDVAMKKREEEDVYKRKRSKYKKNDHATTMSSCKKLQTTTPDDYELEEYFEAL